MFLVDQHVARRRAACSKLLEKLDDPHFTTELGLFQLEVNCDPQLLAGDGIARMEAQLDDLVDRARERPPRARTCGVVLTGILPTMRKTDLGLDNMVPSPRYLSSTRSSPSCAAASSSSRSRASTS